jgi:hypothetical protein
MPSQATELTEHLRSEKLECRMPFELSLHVILTRAVAANLLRKLTHQNTQLHSSKDARWRIKPFNQLFDLEAHDDHPVQVRCGEVRPEMISQASKSCGTKAREAGTNVEGRLSAIGTYGFRYK